MRTLAVASVLALAASQLPAAEHQTQATFQALELKVTTAVRANDVGALELLLSPGFAWAIAFEGRPNDVMGRSEWIKGGLYFDLKSFDIGGLTAETFGKLTLTHFRLTASAKLGESAEMTGGYVVTDLWEQKGKEWKLLRRFVSYPAPLPVKR